MSSFNNRALTLGTTLFTVLAACNNNSGRAVITQQQADSIARPVETKSPNSTYKPAFPGQTRAGGLKTATPLSITVINSSLKRPWAICNLPDGRFLITEKEGTLCIVSADGKTVKAVTGLPAVVPDGQGGLLDIMLDPQFTANRMVYWNYTEQAQEGTVLAVAKGKLAADESKIENPVVIYRTSPAHSGAVQFGSRMLFDDEGNLFVSTGERLPGRPKSNDLRIQSQDLHSTLGKILHITPEGKPVPGGPFANTPDAKPEIFAYGFRNPQGLARNPETGEIWESEFGPFGGDEVNIIRAGKNYGWPVITYGLEYSKKPVGDGIQQKEGMEQPVYYWDPVVSPSGITFYNSDEIPEWKGNLFVSGLSSMHLARLVIKDNKVVGEERLLSDQYERFRSVTVGKDGALYAITDNGKLYRVGK